jgi:hypothetical protein
METLKQRLGGGSFTNTSSTHDLSASMSGIDNQQVADVVRTLQRKLDDEMKIRAKIDERLRFVEIIYYLLYLFL